ncbi:MAG: mercury resistance system transport protein MerF [Acidobacteria bacterium]|nr:mercury resistance system transport protein MerF [Acidobacteriota bacterium]
MTPRGQLCASAAGTVVVALCCFTPILVVALAAVGLAAFTPYLDLVLLPALAILIVVTGISYRRYVRASRARHRQSG